VEKSEKVQILEAALAWHGHSPAPEEVKSGLLKLLAEIQEEVEPVVDDE